MVRYLFYTIGDLTYQSPLIYISRFFYVSLLRVNLINLKSQYDLPQYNNFLCSHDA